MSGTPSRAVLQRTVRHPLPVRLAAEARAVVVSARARLVAVATRAGRSRLLAGSRAPGLVPCPPFGRCLLAPGRAPCLLARAGPEIRLRRARVQHATVLVAGRALPRDRGLHLVGTGSRAHPGHAGVPDASRLPA